MPGEKTVAIITNNPTPELMQILINKQTDSIQILLDSIDSKRTHLFRSNSVKITHNIYKCLMDSNILIFSLEDRFESLLDKCARIILVHNLQRRIVYVGSGLMAGTVIGRGMFLRKVGLRDFCMVIGEFPGGVDDYSRNYSSTTYGFSGILRLYEGFLKDTRCNRRSPGNQDIRRGSSEERFSDDNSYRDSRCDGRSSKNQDVRRSSSDVKSQMRRSGSYGGSECLDSVERYTTHNEINGESTAVNFSTPEFAKKNNSVVGFKVSESSDVRCEDRGRLSRDTDTSERFSCDNNQDVCFLRNESTIDDYLPNLDFTRSSDLGTETKRQDVQLGKLRVSQKFLMGNKKASEVITIQESTSIVQSPTNIESIESQMRNKEASEVVTIQESLSIVKSPTEIQSISSKRQHYEITICGPNETLNESIKDLFKTPNLTINTYGYTHCAEIFKITTNTLKMINTIMLNFKIPTARRITFICKAMREIIRCLQVFWYECDESVFLTTFGVTNLLIVDITGEHGIPGTLLLREQYTNYNSFFQGEKSDGLRALEFFYSKIVQEKLLENFPYICLMHRICMRKSDPTELVTFFDRGRDLRPSYFKNIMLYDAYIF